MDVDDGRTTALVGIPSLPPTGTFTIPANMTATTIVPQKRKQKQATEDSSATEAIDCICGFAYEDGGLSIACDDCGRWCHTTCFNIIEGAVPEEWRCWECLPRPVDREGAVFLQQQRQRQNSETIRRLSPGVEKKPRRASAPAIEGSGGRRKRSILTQQPNHHSQPIRISEEPTYVCEPPNAGYVHISEDVIPNREARQRLERASRGWRGVTALDLPEVELHPPKTVLQPLPPSFISQSPHSICTNPHVRPPSFSLHTAHPVPRSAMITPYPSTILPSSTYLSDPLNAYAYLGMPKPFVHLIGPPLDLALDSRITGSEARFARSGCRPNAVLRPMICNQLERRKKKPSSDEESGMSFGVFALRDIKANEEVVLGWEWDDGHAIHHLPTLIESPGLYSPHHLEHLRNQMSCMLHTLSSTFTTCACGSKSKDCALRLVEAFVDYELPPTPPNTHIDLGPLIGRRRGFQTREKVPFSGGLTGVEMVGLEPMSRATSSSSTDSEPHGHLLDGDVIPRSVVPSTPKPSSVPSKSRKRRYNGAIRSGNGFSSDSDADQSATPRQRQRRRIESQLLNPDPQTASRRTVPAKMRKQWIHQTMEEATPRPTRADEASGTEEEHIDIEDDSAIMPPPPVPPRRKPRKAKKTSASASPASTSSPSIHFAKLSLFSPTVETQKASLDITTSFNQSPLPSDPSSPTPAGPPIKLQTTPISPLLAFTNFLFQPTVTRLPPPPDLPVIQKQKAESPADENVARPASPNLLNFLPSLRRERHEESVPMVVQELPVSLPMDTEPAHPFTDVNPPTLASPSPSPPEIPPVDDQPPDADSSPPRESPPQPPSDHSEPISTHEPMSSPSITQDALQATPQDLCSADPPTEINQESERHPTPSSPVHEASHAPQKVKTSFKDFLMRKKKEQVESPVIPSSSIPASVPDHTIPHNPAHESNPAINLSEETKEAPKKVVEQENAASPERYSGSLSVDVESSSPVPEPEPVEIKPENGRSLRPGFEYPSESWPLDPQIPRSGVAVDLRQDSSREDRGPLPNPTPPPPRVPPEKGDSVSPPPAPQSEDGEIPQDPLPRSHSQQPGNTSFPQAIVPLRVAPINAPTQPRSFQNTWKNNTSIIPPRSNSLAHPVNANLNGSVNNPSNLSNAFANTPNRPSPPSGPKALRGLNPRSPYESSRFKAGVMGSGLNGNGVSGPPVMNGSGMGVGSKRELNPNNGHPGIPKGPSADRDRERERTNGSWSTKNWGGGWR